MIGNTAEIIVYNRTGTADIDTETVWFGHKITGVRVEYDDGTTNTGTGTEGGAVLRVSIRDSDMPLPHDMGSHWTTKNNKLLERIDFTHDAFLLVTKYPALGLDIDFPPTGRIRDDKYESGFLEYMTKEYGTVYRVTRAAHFDLIPHWELEAR